MSAVAPPDHNLASVPVSIGTGAIALLVPALLSISSAPSPNHPGILLWYKTLRMPWFKPPDRIIPVAWIAIDSALSVAGYRLMRALPNPARSKALGWWGTNVLTIGIWNRLFFKKRSLAMSTVAAAGLCVSSVAFVASARRVDRPAAKLGLPLVGWVAFATVLTATIWRLNAKR
jgi:benzodiazapine receptor